MERWKEIPGFPNYSVSDMGNIRNTKFDRQLSIAMNQYGVAFVGLIRNGGQFNRSVPLLVAQAFVDQPSTVFDTPINLNGDRTDNRAENLVWRPRWFAVKYHKQFNDTAKHHIAEPIQEMVSKEIYSNSFECAIRNGVLENEVILAILEHTYTWPTYQQFRIYEK